MRSATLIAVAAVVLALPAEAGHRRPGPTLEFGPNCHAVARASGQSTVYAGSVLGGQNRRGVWGEGSLRDYRSDQGCFVSLAACQTWVTRRHGFRSLPPGYARCTAVFVGLMPAR